MPRRTNLSHRSKMKFPNPTHPTRKPDRGRPPPKPSSHRRRSFHICIAGLNVSQLAKDATRSARLTRASQAEKQVADPVNEEEAARLRLVMVPKDLKEKEAKQKQLEQGFGERGEESRGLAEQEPCYGTECSEGGRRCRVARFATDAKMSTKAPNEVGLRSVI